jgi:hypothetical protein
MLAAPGASCVCSDVPVRIPIAHASRMPFADRSVSPLMVPMTCGRSFGEPQRIFVIQRDNYVYLVPFVEDDRLIALKTIIPSRKATKQYLEREPDDHET